MIWMFPIQSTTVKKNHGIIHNIFTEWCFDPQWKREQRGYCNLFWDKDSKEKEQGIITESPIKNLWSNTILEKNKNKKLWFVNISKYHHRTMGLVPTREGIRIPKFQKYGSSISLNTENVLYRNFNTIEFRKSQYWKFQYYQIPKISILLNPENISTQFRYFQTPSAYLVTILNALVPSNN